MPPSGYSGPPGTPFVHQFDAGLGDTHPFGSPLRRRRDYGERDGNADVDNKINNIEEKMPSEGIMTSKDKRSSESLRVRVVAGRIVAKAKEFLGEK